MPDMMTFISICFCLLFCFGFNSKGDPGKMPQDITLVHVASALTPRQPLNMSGMYKCCAHVAH